MSVAIPVIESIDGLSRRIYLKQGVTAFHWVDDIYLEYKNMRRLDEALRQWNPFLLATGNISKGLGKSTPRLVTLLEDTKVVPYDETVFLYVTGEAITDDADTDATLFDISQLTQPVVVDQEPPGAEIIRLDDASIQYASFGDQVTIDVINGVAGTVFPTGTKRQPVNNVVDALAIAAPLNLKKLGVLGDYDFPGAVPILGYEIIGEGFQSSAITLGPGANFSGSSVRDLTLSGDVNGILGYIDCDLENITSSSLVGFDGSVVMRNCLVSINMQCPANFTGILTLINCWSHEVNPVVDLNGCTAAISVLGYTGEVSIINGTEANDIVIDLISGKVILESSITNGNYTIRGIGSFEDSSTGTTVNTNSLVDARDIKNAKVASETLRHHHTGYGDTYYWDPINGSDMLDGKSAETAVATFAHAHDLVVDGHHDVIIALASDASSTTTTENITISKNYTFLRGPGLDFNIVPTVTDGTPTVLITGNGVEISGMFIGTAPTGVQHAIHVDNCTFTLLDKLWLKKNTGHGIYITNNGLYHRITNTFMDESFMDGIHCDGNVRHFVIENTEIANSVNNGITVQGGDGGSKYARNNVIGANTLIHGCQGYGVEFGPGTNKNSVSVGADLYLNSLGAVMDNGTNNADKSFINDIEVQHASVYGGVFYMDLDNGSSDVLFPVGTFSKPSNSLIVGHNIVDAVGINDINFIGDAVIDGSSTGWVGHSFYGESRNKSLITVNPAADVLNCEFYNARLQGTLDGNSQVDQCAILDLAYVFGEITNSLLLGEITLGGDTIAHVTNCSSGIPGSDTPTINFNDGMNELTMNQYGGGIYFKNKTQMGNVTVSLVGGQVILDATTVTAGKIVVRGLGKLIDSLGNHIPSGTWNGVTISNETMMGTHFGGIEIANGALTADQANQLLELWKLQGLDPDNSMNVTATSRIVDDVALLITENAPNDITVERV